MSAAIAIAAVTTAATIYSQLSAASKDAEAKELDAQSKRDQADELMAREAINEDLMREQAFIASKHTATGQAARGIEGAGIGASLTIASDLRRNLLLSQREAAYKASMLRKGAAQDLRLSSDARTAGYVGAGTTLLSSAGEVVKRGKYDEPDPNKSSLYGKK